MLQKYVVTIVNWVGQMVGLTGMGSKMLENPPQK